MFPHRLVACSLGVLVAMTASRSFGESKVVLETVNQHATDLSVRSRDSDVLIPCHVLPSFPGSAWERLVDVPAEPPSYQAVTPPRLARPVDRADRS